MEKVFLTKEQALSCLKICDNRVHVFMNPAENVLSGADWDLESIEKVLNTASAIEVAGEHAMGMKHGIYVNGEYNNSKVALFLNTTDKIKEFDN